MTRLGLFPVGGRISGVEREPAVPREAWAWPQRGAGVAQLQGGEGEETPPPDGTVFAQAASVGSGGGVGAGVQPVVQCALVSKGRAGHRELPVFHSDESAGPA